MNWSDPQFVPLVCNCCALPAGPNGEQYCWWQCTVMGGREGRDVDAVQLAQVRPAAALHLCCLAAPALSREAPAHLLGVPVIQLLTCLLKRASPLPLLGLTLVWCRVLRTWVRVRSCSTASTTTGWARALTSTWWERSQVGGWVGGWAGGRAGGRALGRSGRRVAEVGMLNVCH